jgi:hypothetical protein
LLVLGKLDNGRKEGLRKELDTNDYSTLALQFGKCSNKHTIVDRLELRDDVESDIRELVLQHLEEHWQEM